MQARTFRRPSGRLAALAGGSSLAAALAAGLALPSPAGAHHGWSSFDTAAPVYVAGTVRQVTWTNPHATLVIEPDAAAAAVPADLAARSVPAQSSPVDAAAVLGKAAPPRRAAARWTIELAPISRMEAWQVAPIAVGERVEVVGYALPQANAEALVRAEFLFRGGRAYGLRSSPAGS